MTNDPEILRIRLDLAIELRAARANWPSALTERELAGRFRAYMREAASVLIADLQSLPEKRG